MPRISEIEDEGDDPILSSIFTYSRENYGGVLNPTKVLAPRPGSLKAAIGLSPHAGIRACTGGVTLSRLRAGRRD